MPPTKVIFKKWKKEGDIIALFPEIKDRGYIQSYQHVGQHGAACRFNTLWESAKPEEYQSLKNELESIGYQLDIKTR